MKLPQERKEHLNGKHFSPFFKGFQLSVLVSGPKVGL